VENARQASFVCVRAMASSEHQMNAGGTWLWIKSFRYAGVIRVAVCRTLNVVRVEQWFGVIVSRLVKIARF